MFLKDYPTVSSWFVPEGAPRPSVCYHEQPDLTTGRAAAGGFSVRAECAKGSAWGVSNPWNTNVQPATIVRPDPVSLIRRRKKKHPKVRNIPIHTILCAKFVAVK